MGLGCWWSALYKVVCLGPTTLNCTVLEWRAYLYSCCMYYLLGRVFCYMPAPLLVQCLAVLARTFSRGLTCCAPGASVGTT